MFRRLLIANRGEIAERVLRTCQRLGVETVVAYSRADADAPCLAMADETVCIGPGPAAHSYLAEDALLQAALQHHCQALHPGYGFLSESARFAARCAQQGTMFVGPRPALLRAFGDKAAARRWCVDAGIPVVPGGFAAGFDADAGLAIAETLGFPVVAKSVGGGGGRGVTVCGDAASLREAFRAARLDGRAQSALYVERYIARARHIELQFVGDRWGRVVVFGERECSIQRRHQKLLEETPSVALDPALRRDTAAALERALSRVRFCGVGTAEFLMDSDGHLYFVELNPRLQVEHGITELVSGVDLVAWQLRLAAGQRLELSAADVAPRGHAIECRINAEDPLAGFEPVSGRVDVFEAPEAWRFALAGPVRLDSHLRSGVSVPPFYDPMIAKLMVVAPTRQEALSRMRQALQRLVVEGIPTTQALHHALLDAPELVSGAYDTTTLQRVVERLEWPDSLRPRQFAAP